MTDTGTAYRPGDDATVLFGTTPTRIFDGIADRIDAALREGVSSLPFLPPSDAQSSGGGGGDPGAGAGANDGGPPASGDERLLAILRKSYGTNLDIAEAYAVRNVFSLPAKCSRRRREEIVTAYLSGSGSGSGSGGTSKDGGGTTDKENVANESSGGANPNDASTPTDTSQDGGSEGQAEGGTKEEALAFEVPQSKSDVPTSADMQSIETETEQLRTKLRTARRLQSDLKLVLTKLGRVETVAREARHTLDGSVGGGGSSGDGNDDNGGGAIHDRVRAAVAARDGLANLTSSGTELLKAMDEEKEARRKGSGKGSDDDEEEEVDLMAAANAAKKMRGSGANKHAKPLTIEEDMERRRKVVKTGDGQDGLGKVTGLLRER